MCSSNTGTVSVAWPLATRAFLLHAWIGTRCWQRKNSILAMQWQSAISFGIAVLAVAVLAVALPFVPFVPVPVPVEDVDKNLGLVMTIHSNNQKSKNKSTYLVHKC